MTTTTEYTTNPTDLAEFYRADLDAYDVDAYALAMHLDTYGMGSYMLKARVFADLDYMEAYNAAPPVAARVAVWRAVITALAALVAGAIR